MAMSNIINRVKIDNEADTQAFVNALEKSERATENEDLTPSDRFVTDPDEIKTAVAANRLQRSKRNKLAIDKNDTAFLSNIGSYTVFSYGDKNISFLTGKNLDRYISVEQWDNGYIVVVSKDYNRPPEEDYIDLVPILQNLMIDPQTFLAPIKKVEVKHAGE